MQLPFKANKKLLGGGRNWIILVFSLLLAFFMWSMMKLSRRYSSYIKYQIEVVSNIEGRKNTARSLDVLVIGAKSTGFNILQNRKENGNLLHLDAVDAKHFHGVEQTDIFYLIPDDIKKQVQDALGKDFVVESFATDTLFFRFPEQWNRKVPVRENFLITYKGQYMPYSPMTVRPDSILIYGDRDVIAKIEEVVSYPVTIDNVSGTLSGVATLKEIEGVRFSHDEIFYNQEVGRYLEKTLTVPVVITDAPSYANVAIVPQQVEIRYREPFSNPARYGIRDFQVGISYNEILHKDVVKPRILKMPDNILSIRMEPLFVECVL